MSDTGGETRKSGWSLRRGLLAKLAIVVFCLGMWRLAFAPTPAESPPVAAPAGTATTGPSGEGESREARSVTPLSDSVSDETTVRCVVQGVVLDVDERPVEEPVTVEACRELDPGGVVRCETQPGSGAFRLTVQGTVSAKSYEKGSWYLVRAVSSDGKYASRGHAVTVSGAGCFGGGLVALRLRPAATLTGRVVDGEGRPCGHRLVRVECAGEGKSENLNCEEYDFLTDESGAFRLPIPGGKGRIAVQANCGAFGAPIEFRCPVQEELDLGVMTAPDGRLAEWELTVLDDLTGVPCKDAFVNYGSQDRWNERAHPRSGGEFDFIEVGEEGVVRVVLACRPTPALVAIGGKRSRSTTLVLDREQPGRRTAVVRLKRRPTVRIKLFGWESDPDQVSVEVRAAMPRITGPIGSDEGVDPHFLRRVAVPSSANAPVHRVLEHHMPPALERVSQSEFLFHPPRAGDYQVAVLAGDDSPILRKTVSLTDDDDQLVRIVLPRGKVLSLDCTEVQAWLGKNGRLPSTTSYCAWISLRSLALDEAGRVEEGRVEELRTIVSTDGRVAGARHRIWVPDGCHSVVFGYCDGDDLRQRIVPLIPSAPEPIASDIPEGDSPTIDVPVPVALATSTTEVVFQLAKRGEPVALEDVEIEIRRHPARAGGGEGPGRTSSVRTSSGGTAVARLFPGEYECVLCASKAFVDVKARWLTIDPSSAGQKVSVRFVLRD